MDAFALFEPTSLEELSASGSIYIVADGVGGTRRGERASQYASEKIRYEYYKYPEIEPGERLRRIMRQVGNEIYQHAHQGEQITSMATTAVVAVVRGNVLTVANVGDSRAYLIRGGRAQQITRDHIIKKNQLSRSLGGESDVLVDVFEDILLRPGDKILLCSDGLSRYATDEDLARLIAEGTPKAIVDRLIDFANSQGGADNISVILIAVHEPEAESPTLIDWDEIMTQPEVEGLTRWTVHRYVREHRIHLALGVGVGFIVGIVVLVAILLRPRSNGLQGVSPPLTVKLTVTTHAVQPRTPIVVGGVQTVMPSVTPSITPTEGLKVTRKDCSSERIIPSGSLPPSVITYTVRDGDSLWKITQNFTGGCTLTVEALKKENGLITDVICPGDILVIPREACSEAVETPMPTPRTQPPASENR